VVDIYNYHQNEKRFVAAVDVHHQLLLHEYAFFFPVLLLYYWSIVAVVNYCGQFRITSFPTSLCGGYIDNCVPLPKSF
jgi:hypothetical protein